MECPSVNNDYQQSHAQLILTSYERLLGKFLLPPAEKKSVGQALWQAECAILSHNIAADPIFTYGNQTALELFAMSWADLVRLPSRLSAEPLVQAERDRLLQEVRDQGFITNYRGVRISSSGQRFHVDRSVVWNLLNDDGCVCGQAAALFEWHAL